MNFFNMAVLYVIRDVPCLFRRWEPREKYGLNMS